MAVLLSVIPLPQPRIRPMRCIIWTQDQLSHTLMPVGEYTRDEIRVLAEEAGLPVAHKPDSQEICFVPDNDYASLLSREAGEKAGDCNFVTEDGRIFQAS